MKNINNNPCEDCTGTHCPSCDFFHANHPEKDIRLNSEFDDRHGDDLLLDVEEDFEYMDPEWDDDFEGEADREEMLSMENPFDDKLSFYDDEEDYYERLLNTPLIPDSAQDLCLGE